MKTPHRFTQRWALALISTSTLFVPLTASALETSYGFNLRYRYEYFDREQDAVTPPDATSKASVVRLGLVGDVKADYGFGAFVEFESVHQLWEDDYNIPTIPEQTIAGYPTILDPHGTEVNQGFLRWQGARKTTFKFGRQEIKLNDGRLLTNSGWRQNHQSFDAVTLTSTPLGKLQMELGYLSRALRVVGAEASNGRADMASQYFQVGYPLQNIGTIKAYGVLLDFERELTNSTDTYGTRFEGNLPLGFAVGGTKMRLLSTLEYAQQRDSADNPNEVDADYRLIELGVRLKTVDVIVGNALLGASSATNKFNTPLAHPFNGWTELFAVNPSLGTRNHGLDARYIRVAGSLPSIQGLSATAVYYNYSADTGSADYGSELDVELVYDAAAWMKNLTIGWRFGSYQAEDLFSDSLRTSLFMVYGF